MTRFLARALVAALFATPGAAAVGALPSILAAQAPDSAVSTARAVRTTAAIDLDGRDLDAVWRTAPISDEFRQFQPAEAAPARFRTAFQVAYDDRTLYVFVRMYDPHPDSIVSLLSRRDVKTPSEWIKIIVDGFHDRRTASQFMVNPAGVKRDASIYADISEDAAWDAVWDVAVSIDSLGWTAEYAIPFSQLRFTPSEEMTFGFGIWRDLARFAERDAWPTYRPSHQTFASQLGDLVGIKGVPKATRLEVMPYFVSKNATEERGAGWSHPQTQSAGLDLKAGLSSNITLDATINPDFGQVEADPALINLSAFEVRFDERRPFFLEGMNIFRCNGPCEGIFYTRRLGRTPQLRGGTDERFTTIQGAAKLTGRLENGTQFGLVASSSARETGANSRVIEPQTTALVGRLVRDFRNGRSQLGTMVTALNRDNDTTTAKTLRNDAYVLLVQGYHRFAQRWELSGYTGRATARGSRQSIARTQLSSVHYFQRPDGDRAFDSTRTQMDGGVSSLQIRRYAGRVKWTTNTRYAEVGTEFNDLGFVTLSDDMMHREQLSISATEPSSWYREANAVWSMEQHWTTGGLPTGFLLQLHGALELPNLWTTSLTWTGTQLGATHCVSCSRGGPALRLSPRHRVGITLEGDARKALVPEFDLQLSTGDEGRTSGVEASAAITGRIGTRVSLELEGGVGRATEAAQWAANYGATFSDTTHYTFARLGQTTIEVNTRANVTLTPTLSLQLYAQPFISHGDFDDWREMVDPYAKSFEDRWAPYAVGAPPVGFLAREFNSNMVLRWEFRPGSQLFLVWQQGRSADGTPGDFEAQREFGRLFASHPDNTLLLKVSYWFNP